MAVGDRLVVMRQKLEAIERYNLLTINGTFTEEALDELKTNAKSLCDEVKDEADLVKTDIDAWS